MIEDRLSDLLKTAPPTQGPALQGLVVLEGARRRTRRRQQLLTAATLVAVAVAVPLILRPGTHQTAPPLSRPTLGVGAPVDLNSYRHLPSGGLVQLNTYSVHGPLGPSSPALPRIGVRLYGSGLVIGTNVDPVSRQLTDEELRHVRELLVESGLDQGGRDYGQPTNVAGALVFQVAGVEPSSVAFGGTVNDVPSSEALLTEDQQHARLAARELAILLEKAVRDGSPMADVQWTRYARRMPGLIASMPMDVAAYPEWKGGALNIGKRLDAETYCTETADSKTDSGFADASSFYSTRVGSMPWYISYEPVYPGEEACALTPYR